MTGRTVLVTGATSGIGKATALGIAAMDARAAIAGRDRGRVEDAAREIRAVGGGQVDEDVTGAYFANRKPARSSTRSHDEAASARLWRVSADLVDPGAR